MGKYPDVVWRIWDGDREEIFFHDRGRYYNLKYVTDSLHPRWTEAVRHKGFNNNS